MVFYSGNKYKQNEEEVKLGPPSDPCNIAKNKLDCEMIEPKKYCSDNSAMFDFCVWDFSIFGSKCNQIKNVILEDCNIIKYKQFCSGDLKKLCTLNGKCKIDTLSKKEFSSCDHECFTCENGKTCRNTIQGGAGCFY